MKTMKFLSPLVIAGVLLGGAACQLAAQTGPGAGGADAGRAGALTEEQRTKLRESMQASRAELTQLNEKLAAAQKEALNAALAKDADEKTVRAKVEAVSKIQTDIAMLRFKALKDVASTITDEQRTQIQERPGMAYNMLMGGFGGMGMGGMGGGGGGARRGSGGGTQ